MLASGDMATRPHLVTIDSLRGIAALSVCLFHLGGGVLPKLSSSQTVAATSWGWAGVEVFFVISGFVIPYVLIRGDYVWKDAGRFLLKRLVRVWPPSAILLLMTLAQWSIASRLSGGWNVTAGQVLTNFLYIAPLVDEPWLNAIFWTLAIEAQFYILIALLFPLFVKDHRYIMGACVLSCVGVFLPFEDTEIFFNYAVYFCMGGLVLLYRECKVTGPAMLAALGALALPTAIGWGWLAASAAVLTALVIAFVPLHFRPLVFLGKISYSLYLTHILVASSSEFLIVRAFHPNTPDQRFGAQLFCLTLVITAAWLFYLLVERRFVDLSQRIGRATTRRPTDAYAAPGAP
jgi:peptidoglycan/LPS O-acetylase OafA/YrhL